MSPLSRSVVFTLTLHFVTPAMADCSSSLLSIQPDLREVAECVKSQQFKSSIQADEIRLLRMEIETLKMVQGYHKQDIEKLDERLFQLRTEVALLRRDKTGAKKSTP